MQCPCDAAPLLVMAFRRCAGNFVGVVDWAEPDDSQCSFSDMTRQLCALPNVSKQCVSVTFSMQGTIQ